MPNEDQAAVSTAWASAYLRLAQAEYSLRDRASAQKHIAIALRLNGELDKTLRVPQIPTEAARISPAIVESDRRGLAREFAQATSGMSSDQRDIYRRYGPPDHVSTFDAVRYSQETWWYGSETYRAGFTFTNGHLTSVYNP